MKIFDFFKGNTAPMSDKEKNGQAWLQIVGGRRRSKGLKTMKELCDEGAIELAMFTKSPTERKGLYKKAAECDNHGKEIFLGIISHKYIDKIICMC